MPEARRLRASSLVGAVLLIGACAEPPAPPPEAPAFLAVGILADTRVADPQRTYILEDGRNFEISIDVTRVVFEGGPGHPFVLGQDATGPFVAVFAHQEGRPDDCHIIPAGGGRGIERGMFIEAEGILWRKTADFRSDVEIPPPGQDYAGLGAFCFDERAQVYAAVR